MPLETTQAVVRELGLRAWFVAEDGQLVLQGQAG
jgi:thiamine biosynthesis lipoprotein